MPWPTCWGRCRDQPSAKSHPGADNHQHPNVTTVESIFECHQREAGRLGRELRGRVTPEARRELLIRKPTAKHGNSVCGRHAVTCRSFEVCANTAACGNRPYIAEHAVMRGSARKAC